MKSAEKFDVIVYGQSIAALVAARELARANCKTKLIAPNLFLGGHFNGLQFWGSDFDVGMNFFEFTSYRSKANANLATYNASDKTDSGRFVAQVQNYIENDLKIECHKVSDLKTVWANLWLDDFLIADRFESLAKLPNDLKTKILAELSDSNMTHLKSKTDSSSSSTNATTGQSLHPSQKNKSLLFLTKSFGEISRSLLGPTFHNTFIEPFCYKIAHTSSDQVMARYHRLTWMPLIYPETLTAALKGEDLHLPPVEFHYPKAGSMRVLCKRLVQDLNENHLVHEDSAQSIAVENGKYALNLASGQTVHSDALIWAHDLDRLNQALGVQAKPSQYQKASVGCCFLRIRREDLLQHFGTAFLTESSQPIYRVTNFDHCAGLYDSLTVRICAEYNLEVFDELVTHKSRSRDQMVSHQIPSPNIFIQALKDSKIIKPHAHVTNAIVREFQNSLLLPTTENYQLFTEQEEAYQSASQNLKAHQQIYRLGACSGFTTSSLNEQIVQALQVAHHNFSET
jgi:phytoene dehydrogenase-like protein